MLVPWPARSTQATLRPGSEAGDGVGKLPFPPSAFYGLRDLFARPTLGWMHRGRVLNWLAGVAAAAGIVGAVLVPWGQVEMRCVEFGPCGIDRITVRIVVALLGFLVSGILLAAASARKNQWKRDARYWRPTDSH
jgi:hypothetical protein